jgi:hypothetical protein
MFKNKIVIILFVFLFWVFSCQKKNPFTEYPEWILGEWIAIDNDNNRLLRQYEYPDGFNFISKDSCKVIPGYMDDLVSQPPIIYYGNTTVYRLNSDTFGLFNLKEKCWQYLKIQFHTPDSMAIHYPEFKEGTIYVRPYSLNKNENFFEQIIIVPYWAEIPGTIRAISINNSGELIYLGLFKNLYDGLYVSKEGKESFKEIDILFQRANYRNSFIENFSKHAMIARENLASHITFVRNKKMITIEYPKDWDKYYSKEFECAFWKTLFLEQQMPIELFDKLKCKLGIISDYGNNIPSIVFRNKANQKLILFYSEQFYLWTQLLNAKKVDIVFTPIYIVNKNIQSDGRYYRYQTDKGETITLDLGFNFIEENELGDKFEDRRKFIPK